MALVTRASVKHVLSANGSKSPRFLWTYSNLREWKKQVNELCVSRFWQNTAQFSIASNLMHQADVPNNFIAFDTMIKNRRSEAARTILVAVSSKASCKKLYNYCSGYGKIKGMHHYTIKQSNNFVMVEFYNASTVEEIVTWATHMDMVRHVPVRTPMFLFRTNKNDSTLTSDSNFQYLTSTNACLIPSTKQIISALSKANSISDQMVELHKLLKLSDTCTRLRFHTAYQIERSFSGLFPKMSVLPFGSTVNGFGKRGCDLDVAIVLDSSKPDNSNNKLLYNTKEVIGYSCSGTQTMECIASTLHLLIPGAVNVRRIFSASVPIIKYKQSMTNVECDVSTTNLSAVYMSELLYLYSNMDWRVTPLVFTIREWASSIGITRSFAGPFITNFSLILMIIFYMQRANVLPSLDDLKNQATNSDVRVTDKYIDCSFLRDLTKLQRSQIGNTESLEQLLLGFFVFLTKFDYERHSISINKGTMLQKLKYIPLSIINPFESNMNVSKNVKLKQVQDLKEAAARAVEILNNTIRENKSPRGIIPLITHYEDTEPRDYSVTTIFDNDDDKTDSGEVLEKSVQTVDASTSGDENNVHAKKKPDPGEILKAESVQILTRINYKDLFAENEVHLEDETRTFTTRKTISSENFDNNLEIIDQSLDKAGSPKRPDQAYLGSNARLLVAEENSSEKDRKMKKNKTRAKR